MKRYNLKNKRGFTLIEVLVVITITALAGAITIVSLREGGQRNKLSTAEREISSVIKLTQSYALQGKTVSSGEAPCGFGFIFSDRTHYKIFYIKADASRDCEYKNDQAAYRHYLSTSSSPTFEEFELSNGVKLDDSVATTTTQVYFTVPHARVFGRTGGTFSGTSITITDASEEETRTIDIDKNGLLEEND